MKYLDITSNEVIEYQELRKKHRNVSLPAEGKEKITIGDSVYAFINPTEFPNNVFVIQEGIPVLKDGIYYQTWETREFTQDELAELAQ